MDDLFTKPERKSVRELNLVPVIDMFTTVIFFLILSTSFFGFTKLTLPPSKVSVNTDPLVPPPLSTKLFVGQGTPELRLLLTWVGESPGQSEATSTPDKIEDAVGRLVAKFKERYPNEETVQLGLMPGVSYQAMISTMDGVRAKLPDVVLISPEEAATRLAAMGKK